MESTTTRLNSILAAATEDPSAALAKSQRSLLKLAFALRGQSDELDQILLRLTNSLRSGNRDVDVTQIVDSAVAALGRRRDAAGESDRAASLKRLLEQAIGDAQRQATVEAAARLSDLRHAVAVAADERAMQSALTAALGELLAAKADTAGESPDAALSSLQLLLDALQLPDTMNESSQDLQKELARRPPPSVADASVAIAQLVNRSHETAGAELERMASFIQQAAGKIAQLQQQLHLINHANDQSIRESEALNESVSGHVREIRDSVETATDIVALRSSIAGNLESLHQGVGDFVSSARERRVATEELLTRLNNQLNMLEGETRNLGEGLRRERENASTDSLTGLPNRRALDTYIASLARPGSNRSPESGIVVIDIDHFKSINDRYGHQAGDRVLRGVADLLRSQLRTQDFIARYGGEEFVVVLPGATMDQAAVIAERMRAHVESCRFRSGSETVPVTVSMGVANLGRDDNIESALQRADRAMYLAKSQGRNQTVRAIDRTAA